LGVCVRVLFFAIVGVVLAMLRPGKPAQTIEVPRAERAGLTVRQEPNRVVMVWDGAVEPPMKQRFEDAFRALGNEPKRVLISWNSPGGRVDHGHEVFDVIQAAARVHYIDTTVDAGKICASMCVPLYLSGMERTAHPKARFMFHEVILKLKPEAERAVRELDRYSPGLASGAYKQAVGTFTDRLFEDGFESKVNNRWLANLRGRIKGRDVWLTGRQLVEEKSGVVDKLL
jgi:hypothetical protein